MILGFFVQAQRTLKEHHMRVPIRLRRGRKEAAPAMLDPINDNINAVVALHALAEGQVDAHQRTVESLTAWLGRPQFFYGILVGVGF